jgi:hypothetical protein
MYMDRPFPTPVIHRIQTPIQNRRAVSDLRTWEGNIVQPVGQRATGKAR